MSKCQNCRRSDVKAESGTLDRLAADLRRDGDYKVLEMDYERGMLRIQQTDGNRAPFWMCADCLQGE